MSNEKEQIKANHKVSWNGIISILFKQKIFQKLPFVLSLILSFVFCVIIGFLKIDKSFFLLQTISDLTLSVFPALLGFSLGGYAIAVGFSNVELIEQSTEIDKHSIYQILSAIFALSILFQVFTTIICFFVSWFIKINISDLFGLSHCDCGNILNLIILFFILFGSLYSLCLTPYVVVNLFTLSQLNNLFFTIKNKVKK